MVAPGEPAFSDFQSSNLLGIQHQILGLARALTRRDHEAYIVRMWHVGSSAHEAMDGLTLVNLPSGPSPHGLFRRFAAMAVFSLRARECVKTIRPDALILTELVTSLFLATLPIRKIYVTHNRVSGLGWGDNPIREAAKRLVERFVFANCSTIVALNSAILRNLNRRGYNAVEIPNAVEMDQYPDSAMEGAYILFSGRLEKIKGLHFLVRAYTGIEGQLRGRFRLVLAGYGPEEARLKKEALNLGIGDKVDFRDWQTFSEFVKNMASCAVFVLPSLSESFPVTLVEAMACGKTVIASNIPGPSDIIQHGRNGMLFEAGDVRALTGLLESVLREQRLRIELGANARRTVKEGFTFDRIVVMYENALAGTGDNARNTE